MASTIICDIVSAEAEIFTARGDPCRHRHSATGHRAQTPLICPGFRPGKVVVTQPNGEVLDFRHLRRHPRGAADGGDRARRHRGAPAQDIDEAAVHRGQEEPNASSPAAARRNRRGAGAAGRNHRAAAGVERLRKTSSTEREPAARQNSRRFPNEIDERRRKPAFVPRFRRRASCTPVPRQQEADSAGEQVGAGLAAAPSAGRHGCRSSPPARCSRWSAPATWPRSAAPHARRGCPRRRKVHLPLSQKPSIPPAKQPITFASFHRHHPLAEDQHQPVFEQPLPGR